VWVRPKQNHVLSDRLITDGRHKWSSFNVHKKAGTLSPGLDCRVHGSEDTLTPGDKSEVGYPESWLEVPIEACWMLSEMRFERSTCLLGRSWTFVEVLLLCHANNIRTRFLDPTLLGIWSSAWDAHVSLSCDVLPSPMREDLCKLGPSLGRLSRVLWPAPGDGSSDNLTIHH